MVKDKFLERELPEREPVVLLLGETVPAPMREEQVKISSTRVNAMQSIIQNEENVNDSFFNDLHNNDHKILSLLSSEIGSRYSFRGLMKKLDLHQQSLARSLHRLEYLGLIERVPFGYKISNNRQFIMMSKRESIVSDKIKKRNLYMQLLQTYIPINLSSSDIIKDLKGKWFHNFRWAALTEDSTGYDLQWVGDNVDITDCVNHSNDSYYNSLFQIRLRIMSRYILVETNADSYKEKVDAMIGSYRILQYITKLAQKNLVSSRITCPTLTIA
jgi:predicted transcriptional regulator